MIQAVLSIDTDLYEYRDAIEKQFSLTLSLSLLSRFLSDKDINRKKVYSLALMANV
jgi:hypothetical protein